MDNLNGEKLAVKLKIAPDLQLDMTCNSVWYMCNHLSSFDELIKRQLAD